MAGVKIYVTGVDQIDNVLKGMPRQLTDKVLQTANAAAAKPLITRAQLMAPEGPNGYVVDSIGVVKTGFNQVASLQRGVGAISVGPRRGGSYKGWHAHLIEFGTKGRYTLGKGRIRKVVNAFRGIMKARPFMQPAFEATKNVVLASINTEIGKKLNAFMKKTIKNSR